ncbi:MAG: hypothetical protein Kow0068_07200 [Marinilabiliales bacterium]
MVKILLVVVLLFASYSVFAKKLIISGKVYGDSGCVYVYEGWINFSLFPPSVDCYDVTIYSPNCDFNEHIASEC